MFWNSFDELSLAILGLSFLLDALLKSGCIRGFGMNSPTTGLVISSRVMDLLVPIGLPPFITSLAFDAK